MLNWTALIINSFWITGLAVLLAGFSYHSWQATTEERPLSEQLQRRSFLIGAWFGLVLIGIGLAGSSRALWETIIWSLFTLIAAVNAVKEWGIGGRPTETTEIDGN